MLFQILTSVDGFSVHKESVNNNLSVVDPVLHEWLFFFFFHFYFWNGGGK